MASDFAVPRFRFLQRLLIVHGHWCYARLASMALYFFYKNTVRAAPGPSKAAAPRGEGVCRRTGPTRGHRAPQSEGRSACVTRPVAVPRLSGCPSCTLGPQLPWSQARG